MSSIDSTYSLSKRGYVMVFAAVGLQILLAGLALCYFIDFKPYVQDVGFTWVGVLLLLPVVLFLAHCTTFYFLWRSSKQLHPRLAGLVLSSLLPIVYVGLWWVLLAVALCDHRPEGVYYWFSQSGLMPPLGLIALKWLAVVLSPFTLAALLGLVPIGVALRIVGRAGNNRGLRIAGLVAFLILPVIVLIGLAIVMWLP